MLIISGVLIVSLIVDTSIIKVYCISSCATDPHQSIPVFLFIAIVFCIGQYFILKYVNTRSKGNGDNLKPSFKTIQKIIQLTQYVLISILVIITLQMILSSTYSTVLLVSSTIISYALAAVMMFFLAERFFLWFKTSKSSVVLSYAIASAILASNFIVTLIFVDDLLLLRPTEVRQFLIMGFPSINYSPTLSLLNQVFVWTSILSFMLMWISTSLLMRHYSQRLGRTKYWIIVSIPLVYFLSQFVSAFVDTFNSIISLNPILYSIILTIVFTLSKPVGGILFGVAFWTVAKNIGKNTPARDYMIISAYGVAMLFISNQAIVLVNVPYPPFGLVTVSFFGLASFLMFNGIYSSAISVAEDSELRKSIRRYAIEESRLLDSIGMAQMERQIEKKVLAFTKRNQYRMIEKTGIQSSLSEDDMKQYLQQVIEEVKKTKNPSTGAT